MLTMILKLTLHFCTSALIDNEQKMSIQLLTCAEIDLIQKGFLLHIEIDNCYKCQRSF